MELGYGTTHKAFQETEIRYNRLTGDGLVYVPLGGFLNFLVTAGLSDTNFGASTFQHKSYQQDGIDKTTRVATTVLTGDELNWRGGAGLSFSFGGGYEFHVIGRYRAADHEGPVELCPVDGHGLQYRPELAARRPRRTPENLLERCALSWSAS